MITRVSLSNVRGVASLDTELFPVTALVAPNNSGKSTILEALTIASREAAGVGDVVNRRGWAGFQSLAALSTGNDSRIRIEEGETYTELEFEHGHVLDGHAHDAMRGAGMSPHGSQFLALWRTVGNAGGSSRVSVGQCQFDSAGQKFIRLTGTPRTGGNEGLIFDHSLSVRNLDASLSAVTLRGADALEDLIAQLRTIDPELSDIRSANVAGNWLTYVVYKHATVPLVSVGDGMKRLVGLAGTLAAAVSLALLEEPESFQHSGVFPTIAAMIWKAADAGIQVVLSTHSMDLVRTLRSKAPPGAFGIVEMSRDKEGRVTTKAHANGMGAVCRPRTRRSTEGIAPALGRAPPRSVRASASEAPPLGWTG